MGAYLVGEGRGAAKSCGGGALGLEYRLKGSESSCATAASQSPAGRTHVSLVRGVVRIDGDCRIDMMLPGCRWLT